MSFKIVVLAALLGYVSAKITIDPALCKLDLVLCLDNSGSIGFLDDGTEDPAKPPANWNHVIDFSKNLANQLTVSPTGSQVGLVDFGQEARIQFGLNKYQSQSTLSNAIGNVQYIGDTTNTTGGLYKSRIVLTDPQWGLRTGKSKIAVLITDGLPNVDEDKVFAEAQNCREAGIRVIVVGIGTSIKAEDEALMKKIAYSPDDYVAAEDFSDLERINDVVLNDNSCRPLPITATPAPPPAPDC